MVKFIFSFVMFIFGSVPLLVPVPSELGGNITGHIWIVGAILLAWMPLERK